MNKILRDPSMEQTAAGLSNIEGIDTSFKISFDERKVLRELALRVAELSARPIETIKKKLWTAHNDLQSTRPLIFCDPENGWNEIITQDQILCSDPLLRVWEMSLRKEIFWAEQMKDDRVIEGVFYVPYFYNDSGYGLSEIEERTSSSGSFHYISPITDYERDFPKLRIPQINIDVAKSRRVREIAQDLFADIMPVRQRGLWWWTLGMTWDYIKLRGLENLMMDMILYPDWVHQMMKFLSDSVHHKLDYLQNNGLLSLNTEGAYVGSGGFGWTDSLPSSIPSGQRVKTSDMWGFCESQETVGVSPEMFGEFIFPYQLTIMERFGLNCYGCCEPINPRWQYVSKIPRLRRVSASPWADLNKMAEQLTNNYVMSVKPSPTPLATAHADEHEIRKSLETILEQTKDCHIEIIMKDNHTLGGSADNAIKWCRIASEIVRNL